MVSNSSAVPRRMLRNSGMSPMPSGSRRMTSSVTPGRRVGLIMPTTPRQLENAMTMCPPRRYASPYSFFLGSVGRDISLGYVAGKRGRIARVRIAAAAAACALQEEALARAHLVASRRGRCIFLCGAEADDEARAAPRLAAGDA